jgi:hypothetical protein
MPTRTQLKNHHEIRVIFQRMALEIAESFAMNRPFMMPNREREIEKQNKYKNIPKETRKELKIL